MVLIGIFLVSTEAEHVFVYVLIICCARLRVSSPGSAGMPKAECTEQALLSGFGMLQFPEWKVSPVRMLHAGVALQQPPEECHPCLPGRRLPASVGQPDGSMLMGALCWQVEDAREAGSSGRPLQATSTPPSPAGDNPGARCFLSSCGPHPLPSSPWDINGGGGWGGQSGTETSFSMHLLSWPPKGYLGSNREVSPGVDGSRKRGWGWGWGAGERNERNRDPSQEEARAGAFSPTAPPRKS